MSEDELIQSEILEILAREFDNDPYKSIDRKSLLNELELPENQFEGHILRLESKGLIKVERYLGGNWTANLTPSGYEYYITLLDKLEDETSKSDTSHSLEIEVSRENFQAIMKVFISHKFVKDDQKLALTLRNVLVNKDIDGYLAESNKELELLLSEKIRQKIEEHDYLVAIITRESEKSASVNQEIGYALGFHVPVLLLVEKGVESGVLTQGREIVEFTRDNFRKSCETIRDYILEKGVRIKLTKADQELLQQEVYRPMYNKIVDFNERIFHLQNAFPNPWNTIEHYLKIKIEPHILILFEKFSEEIENWNYMLRQREYDYTLQRSTLGEIFTIPFRKTDLFDEKIGNIILDKRSSQSPLDWMDKFRPILFNPNIKDSETLYEMLEGFASLTKDDHRIWLQNFKRTKPELFDYILEQLPQARKAFHTTIGDDDLLKQKQILKEITNKLQTELAKII